MSAIQRRSAAAMLLACTLAAGCHESHPSASGNSNWLDLCSSDADCEAGFACACGLCTKRCDSTPECDESGEVRCIDPASGPTHDQCAAELVAGHAGICLVACASNAECAAPRTCVGGACIVASSMTPMVTGREAGAADTGLPQADATVDACDPALESCGTDSGSASMADAGTVTVRAFREPIRRTGPVFASCEAGSLLVDSGAMDEAWALAIAGDSLLTAGRVNIGGTMEMPGNAWRIEQRALADLALRDRFGEGGVAMLESDAASEAFSTPRAMAVDSDSLYTAGIEWDGEAGFLRVEKRSLESGAPAEAFGVDGTVHAQGSVTTTASFAMQGVLVEGPHLYMTGSMFTVEKRFADDGALVSEFGASGLSQSSAGADSLAQVMALRDGVLYVAGSEGYAGLRLEARDAQTSELLYEVTETPVDEGCSRQGFMALVATDDALYLAGTAAGRWRVERRRRSDGTLVYLHELPLSGDCDFAFALAVDDTSMYVAGGNAGSWRVEKRALVDGALVAEFGEGGVIASYDIRRDGEAHALALHDGVLYVAGRSGFYRVESLFDWRLVRLSAADGSTLGCPSGTSEVPFAPDCGSTPTVESAGLPQGSDCTVRVATSPPCAGTNVRASANATSEEDWRLHYASAVAEGDWGLATSGTLFDQPSNYLVARGFGFDLPEDARVLGIEFEVSRDKDGFSTIEDHAIRLVKGDQILDAERARAGSWNAGPRQVVYGGTDDLWETTWTAAEINESSFGVALRVHPLEEGAGGQVDDLHVRVYYCE